MCLGGLSSLRNQPFLANNYQRPWLYVKPSATLDRSHLHNCSYSGYCRCLCCRQIPQESIVSLYLPLLHVAGFHNVSFSTICSQCFSLTVLSHRCISSANPRVIYAGVFISVCAIYPAFPCVVTWLSNNLAGPWKRGAGMALQIGVGNLGGVSVLQLQYHVVCQCSTLSQAMASNFYRHVDQPRYFLGHGLVLGFVVAGLVATGVLVLGYRVSNKKRAQQIADGSVAAVTPQQLAMMGDKAPTFRYMY